MAPVSNMRKSSAANAMAAELHPSSALGSAYAPRRSTSGRAIRVSTTRPANYYARPFGSFSGAADHDAGLLDAADAQAHGFFPGLQYFTDAITALPKEVIKQFTLMKEVEAKIHGPSEKLGDLIEHLMTQPVPAQRSAGAGAGAATAQQGLLSFTAHNSISGSTNASMINGVLGRQDAQASVNGSVNEEEQAENQEETARRIQYAELCKHLKSLIPNLDEKYGVLEEANRVLALQQLRLDSVMPQIETEISEDSRLGSMTHWAYADNRQKRHATSAASRRDVASANNLAAAASLIHEHEISSARITAGREAAREKGRGKRVEHPGDSDFDDKPKKQKLSKAKAAANAAAGLSSLGLGISASGESVNKRKKVLEKGASAAGMERTASSSGRGAKAARDAPRSNPALDNLPAKKAVKGKPAAAPPKKKPPTSAQASPMLASSPLASSFTMASVDTATTRPQSSRLRHNGGATSLRHERGVEEDSVATAASSAGKSATHTSNNPTSANGGDNTNLGSNGPTNGSNVTTGGNGVTGTSTERIVGKKKGAEAEKNTDADAEAKAEADNTERQLREASERLKHEDVDMTDVTSEPRPAYSHSGSNSNENSNRNSGRASGAGTPKADNPGASDAAMSRTRSARGKSGVRAEGRDESSTEPGPPVTNRHRRVVSNSHLVKQLAPFNRSPDLDRHRSRDSMDDELNSGEEAVVDPEEESKAESEPEAGEAFNERASRRSSGRRLISSRNGAATRSPPAAAASREPSPDDIEVRTPPAPPATRLQRSAQSGGRTSQPAPVEDEEDEDSEHDPDDPNEPKYCYCNRGSYGEMVACDNDDCPREWFHLGCTELREAPGEEEVWYCRECRPKFGRKPKGRSGR